MKKEDLKVGMKIQLKEFPNSDPQIIVAIGNDLYIYQYYDDPDNIGDIYGYLSNIYRFDVFKEKKKATLYRYTYKRYNGALWQTNWESKLEIDNSICHDIKIKTETKEIEIDEE